MASLMGLQAKTATLIIADGENVLERAVPVGMIHPGDVVKVVPGAAIPVDGVVIWGQAAVDESMVTGESMPLAKRLGDEVRLKGC